VGEEGKGGGMGENRAKRRGKKEDGRGWERRGWRRDDGGGGEPKGRRGERGGTGELWKEEKMGEIEGGRREGEERWTEKRGMKECRRWGWGYTAQASGTYSITTVNFCRHDNRVRVHACSHNCAECLVRIHGPRPACWSGGTRG